MSKVTRLAGHVAKTPAGSPLLSVKFLSPCLMLPLTLALPPLSANIPKSPWSQKHPTPHPAGTCLSLLHLSPFPSLESPRISKATLPHSIPCLLLNPLQSQFLSGSLPKMLPEGQQAAPECQVQWPSEQRGRRGLSPPVPGWPLPCPASRCVGGRISIGPAIGHHPKPPVSIPNHQYSILG